MALGYVAGEVDSDSPGTTAYIQNSHTGCQMGQKVGGGIESGAPAVGTKNRGMVPVRICCGFRFTLHRE